jgi:hypothetical protein
VVISGDNRKPYPNQKNRYRIYINGELIRQNLGAANSKHVCDEDGYVIERVIGKAANPDNQLANDANIFQGFQSFNCRTEIMSNAETANGTSGQIGNVTVKHWYLAGMEYQTYNVKPTGLQIINISDQSGNALANNKFTSNLKRIKAQLKVNLAKQPVRLIAAEYDAQGRTLAVHISDEYIYNAGASGNAGDVISPFDTYTLQTPVFDLNSGTTGIKLFTWQDAASTLKAIGGDAVALIKAD